MDSDKAVDSYSEFLRALPCCQWRKLVDRRGEHCMESDAARFAKLVAGIGRRERLRSADASLHDLRLGVRKNLWRDGIRAATGEPAMACPRPCCLVESFF